MQKTAEQIADEVLNKIAGNKRLKIPMRDSLGELEARMADLHAGGTGHVIPDSPVDNYLNPPPKPAAPVPKPKKKRKRVWRKPKPPPNKPPPLPGY